MDFSVTWQINFRTLFSTYIYSKLLDFSKRLRRITTVMGSFAVSTHHFLTEEDIQYYKPLIRNEYFQAVELHIIRDETNTAYRRFYGVRKILSKCYPRTLPNKAKDMERNWLNLPYGKRISGK